MIPFFNIKYSETESGTPEQKLARELGQPPFETKDVSCFETVSDFMESHNSPLVGMIFDPYFWYSHKCWHQWTGAISEDGSDEIINVPLGNQHPAWRDGLSIPPYLTISGLERASSFKSKTRWIIRTEARQEIFCVVIVPLSVLAMLPQTLPVGEIPQYWAQHAQACRIFCEGWLHSFGAIKEAGRRQDLLDMCKWHGKVLELGCGTGLMAKSCKEQGSDVCWIGLDFNQADLSQARLTADLAICGDIHFLPISANVRFDRIVCGDVLEHLPYPWETLKKLGKWIKPGGLLIASVPNVGHWAIIEDLLAGRWDEAPSGILCVSHLRFGTKKSWKGWFHRSGWQIIQWESEKLPPPDNWEPRHLVDCDSESLETIRYKLVARYQP